MPALSRLRFRLRRARISYRRWVYGWEAAPNEWERELALRALQAEVQVALGESRATGRDAYVEKECGRLHPHPDRPFETSVKLGFRYQECESCGQVTGSLIR